MKIVEKKKKKAQQLIEFLFVVPFMIIILGILTEYAYALNINMTLSQGLKTVASSVYREIKPGMTPSDIRNNIVTPNYITYLSNNNVPTNVENNIQVGYAIVGQTAVFIASYTYIPAFTLPNVYFKFMPDSFNFFATTAVPAAFLKTNNYIASTDSRTLDKIWSNSASFSTQDDFNASKKGIMKDDASGGRSHMLFLVPASATDAPGLTSPYQVISWNGTALNNGGLIYTIDANDGNLYECSNVVCNLKQRFFNYLTSNNIYNSIFIHDLETPSDLTQLSNYWVNPAASTDLSANSVNGILKRALALADMSNLSVGDYDNSSGNTYSVINVGSIILVYSNADDISKITGGAPPTDINNADWK